MTILFETPPNCREEVFSETPSNPPVTYSASVDEGIEAIMLVLDIVLIVLVLFLL